MSELAVAIDNLIPEPVRRAGEFVMVASMTDLTVNQSLAALYAERRSFSVYEEADRELKNRGRLLMHQLGIIQKPMQVADYLEVAKILNCLEIYERVRNNHPNPLELTEPLPPVRILKYAHGHLKFPSLYAA